MCGHLKHSSVEASQGPGEDGEPGAENVFTDNMDDHLEKLMKSVY